MDIKAEIINEKFKSDPLRDQFFLIDEKIVNELVSNGQISKNDVVLEIGAGFGNITGQIAKSAKKVIAFEIDKRFKPYLSILPENVDVRYEDAWNFIQLHGKIKKKREFNKIIANLPYSFCEKLLHNLTFLEYKKVVLIVPLKFVKTIKENAIFASFFECELINTVNKNSFYPVPKTNSALINLKKLPDPIKNNNLSLFLRQYVYQHEKQKVKNSLREGLITFAKLTKNQARKIIQKANLDLYLLEKEPSDFKIYDELKNKF